MSNSYLKSVLTKRPFRKNGLENFVLNSENITTSNPWIGNGVTSNTNVAIGPDGLLSADLITETNTNSTHLISQSNQSFTSGLVYTFSVFVKKSSTTNARDFIQLTTPGSPFGINSYSNYDIFNGVVTYTQGLLDTRITPFYNGWFRISNTAIATSTVANTTRIAIFLINSANSVRGLSYLGDTNSGILLFGAQVNLGYPITYRNT